jgi:DNA (cytosine-5)-methyltransferase 1
MGQQQASIFEFLYDQYRIDKPIRLIELFSGIGAQAKALENLGANFESWRTCDWAVPSIHAYAAIHCQDIPCPVDFSKIDLEARMHALVGVSANYNEPMTYAQITKKSEEWINSLLKSKRVSRNLINIMEVHADDLGIIDLDKYTYVTTYSFPCQDLSLAGHKKGMSVSQAVGGTRSGLLWEVERILGECKELDCLPQVLIMENVPEVVGVKNIKDFQKWRAKLESLGYSNYCEILNAKDYGIPQNRRRCFMVSILGEYSFTFPRRMHHSSVFYDFLENNVDERYFLSQKMVDYRTGINQKDSKYNRGKAFKYAIDQTSNGTAVAVEDGLAKYLCNKLVAEGKVKKGDVVKYSYTNQILSGNKKCVERSGEMVTLTTRPDCLGVVVEDSVFSETEKQLFTEDGNIKRYLNSDKVDEFKEGQMATTSFPNGYGHGPRVHDESVTLNTVDKPVVKKNLRIRKLTPLECLKLMGFDKHDYDALRSIGQSDAQIYHEAGDSIVVTVLMGIFGSLLGIDYEPIIQRYVESLKEVSVDEKVR